MLFQLLVDTGHHPGWCEFWLYGLYGAYYTLPHPAGVLLSVRVGGLVVLLRLKELLRNGCFRGLFEEKTQVQYRSVVLSDRPLWMCVADGALHMAGLILPTGPTLLARCLFPLLG